MNDYMLKLESGKHHLSVSLSLKDADDILKDYHDKSTRNTVYNDYDYQMSVEDALGTKKRVEFFAVNHEEIEDTDVLKGNKAEKLFSECFGIVKMEVGIDGETYVTPNLVVMVKDGSLNANIINMVDYIYDNCDEYLYEEHKSSKINSGISPDSHISVDSKLSLLDEIYDSYEKCFFYFKNAAHTKLIYTDKIGDFSELHSIHQNTIRYIATHPEELHRVNYNSGITYNKEHYQPRKTLVKSVSYSKDTFENRVIVGFIKTIIRELKNIKETISAIIYSHNTFIRDNEYIESAYFIYTRNDKLLKKYVSQIESCILKYQKLFGLYKSILNVQDVNIILPPEYTKVFQSIMPYNIIYNNMMAWFSCGKYDLLKSNLLLSFISTSKIYEYFCLIKINKALVFNGFKKKDGYSHKYKEDIHYKNTVYNNTFIFEKKNTLVTIYFQPKIYGNDSTDRNGIDLFRSTSIGLKNDKKGYFYTPDFVIKVKIDENINYYIVDSKYKYSQKVKTFELPELAFKYLFSISPLSKGSLSGLYILCGKESRNNSESAYDIASEMKISVSPVMEIVGLSGTDSYDDSVLSELFNQIEALSLNAK